MIYQKVSYPFGPVTLAAGTKKLIVAYKTQSGKVAMIDSLRAGLLGTGSTDASALWHYGILSGDAAGGGTVTGVKNDREVASTAMGTCKDATSAYTGTVPTVSSPVEAVPLYPAYTLNPDKVKGLILAANENFGIDVTAASGGAAAPTVAGTIDVWEPV